MKKIVIGVLCIVAFIFLINEFSIFGIKFWGKRTENAKREVFEQTQSYVEGKRQELVKYHHEWMLASPEDKKTIEATVRMSFANFDENKIEQPELFDFLKRAKYQ